MSKPDDFSYSHWDDFPRYIWGQLKTPIYNVTDAMLTYNLMKGYEAMNEITNVEDLIQASKDQNGRVYSTLKNQESRIKKFEDLLRSPVSAYNSNQQVFNILVDRIGTKGILKMLAER